MRRGSRPSSEAKPVGTTLSGVEWRSATYATGLPEGARKRAVLLGERLPFVFEASGSETHLTNGFDPDPRARQVFVFPQPATCGPRCWSTSTRTSSG